MIEYAVIFVLCASPSAPPLTGGNCCLSEGQCVNVPDSVCESLGGYLLERGLSCYDDPTLCTTPNLGSCCLPCDPVGQFCELGFPEEECLGSGGIWSDDSICDDFCVPIFDCDNDGVDDFCQGTSDLNGNEVPDTCECIADLNVDGLVGHLDMIIVLGRWGNCSDCSADIIFDGIVNEDDLVALIVRWGQCQ